jgi:hypothetical protein
VYYLDPVAYGGAVKYVEKLVAGIDPAEFHVVVACPGSPNLAPFREALAPFAVEWFSPLAVRASDPRAAAYGAVSGRPVLAKFGARIGGLPGIRAASKAALGAVQLLAESRQAPRVERVVRDARPALLGFRADQASLRCWPAGGSAPRQSWRRFTHCHRNRCFQHGSITTSTDMPSTP